MQNLTPEKALEILEEARKLNPKGWIEHSINVGKAAKKIAEALGEDADKAESFGYIHDIGRRVGKCSLSHTIEGYKYLKELGYDDAARICLTHGFMENSVEGAFGQWDMPDEEKEFVKDYVEKTQLNIYDKIIQLADCIALPSGITTIERRMADVCLRYGFDEYTEGNLKERLTVQHEIEEKLGYSIFKLFKEEVIENLENNKTKDVYSFLK